MRRIIVTGLIAAIVLVACVETEPVSPVPQVTFKSLEPGILVDTLLDQYLPVGILTFDFIDGDADIGVEEEIAGDSTLSDSIRYNLFLTPYSKFNGHYALIEYDSIPPYYSIINDPKLSRSGQNKTIKGTITLIIVDLPDFDTIRYDFMLRDRSGNNSNTESTTDIGTRINVDSGF